jgi:dipeptidyl aminopeptidase/acylaminoacyl peptidase
VLWAGRRLFERPELRIAQLTFRTGSITGARFTSDERTVIYSASWDGKENEIFLTRRDGRESRSLGLPPAKLLSVSSRDELAILLTKPGEVGDPALGTLARVPLAGGVPRPVLEDVEDAEWSPDGQDLAVIRNAGGVRWLEYPLGTVLRRPLPDSFPHGLRVSPGGDKVAISADGLSIVDRSGGHRSFPFPPTGTRTGLAWAPRGDAVWVTTSPGGLGAQELILQIGLDGSRREVFRAPGHYVLHDVAKSGAALLHHGNERNWIRAKARGGEERDLTGLRMPFPLDISPDGSQVVIWDAADDKLYLCAVQGGEPLLLTHTWERTLTDTARLSPDGKWLLVVPSSPDRTARLVPIGAGEPRDLPRGGMVGRFFGSFLDTGLIYWLGAGGETPRRGFVQDVASGAVRAVTPEGVEALLSPLVDGALLGRQPDGKLAWFPVAGGEPRPTAARLPPGSSVFQTTSDGRAAFVSVGGIPFRIDRIDLVTGRREVWKKLAPPDLAGIVFMFPWIPMTPDGEAYAYHYLRVLQDLSLVEGLR